VLCQSSLRLIVTKLLNWGPTRAMNDIKPYVPKVVRTYMETDEKKQL
jgi:hypothetical protein